jgi:hypothetical protein
MISQATRRLYDRFRKAGCGAQESLRSARILRKWNALDRLGAVRIRIEDDEDFTPDEDNCCCEDPRCSARTGPAYGTVGEYRTDWHDRGSWHLDDGDHSSVWVHADSVWGHTGYRDPADPVENCYVIGIMAETIDAFRAAWQDHLAESARPECPTCHGTGRI